MLLLRSFRKIQGIKRFDELGIVMLEANWQMNFKTVIIFFFTSLINIQYLWQSKLHNTFSENLFSCVISPFPQDCWAAMITSSGNWMRPKFIPCLSCHQNRKVGWQKHGSFSNCVPKLFRKFSLKFFLNRWVNFCALWIWCKIMISLMKN